MVYPILFILLLGLVLTSVFPRTVMAGPPGPGGGPPPLVTVMSVILQDINPPREYVGHVQAIQTVDLQPRVKGYLDEVKFKEGDYVHAGDILYVIEQPPYQAEVNADKARVAAAQAALFRAQRHLERLQAARPESVSATNMDNAVAEERRARAQLEEAKAMLKIASINLGYTVIKAPISGRMGRTAFTRGNLVGPDTGAMSRIVQMDPIRVIYPISENDLAAMQLALRDASNHQGKSILVPRIKLPNGTLYKAAGYVDFIDNQVDPGTGTISVWAVFPNPNSLLVPGMYVTVLVSRSKPKMMPVVPQSAVQEDHKGRYVLLVDNKNRVVQRRITIGPVVGTNWAVKSGLGTGERVIVEGILKVRPGQIVQTRTASKRGES